MGETRSGTVTVTPEEAGDPVTVVEIGPSERLNINDFKAAYSYEGAATSVGITIYDEEDGVVDPSTEVDKEIVEPGDRYAQEGVSRNHIEEGVVVVVDGQADADVVVTVGGELQT